MLCGNVFNDNVIPNKYKGKESTTNYNIFHILIKLKLIKLHMLAHLQNIHH
jgi:hypothetical protein